MKDKIKEMFGKKEEEKKECGCGPECECSCKDEDTKVEDSNGTVLKNNQPVIEKIVMID